jgi:hypothetical protein
MTSRSEGRLRRAWRWLTCDDPVLGAALLLLCAYYAGTRGVFQGKASGDGWFGFMYLRALFFERTLDMKSVIPEYLPYFSTAGPHHRMPNRCPFGPVFAWAPFYLLACALHSLGRLLQWTKDAPPQTAFHAWVTGLGTFLPVLVGVREVYALTARHFGRGAARLGAIASVWATPIAWYAVTQVFYQHGLAFALVAVLVERWDARLGHSDARRFVLLGLVGGAAMMMRAQEALYLLLPGGEIVYRLWRGPDRRRWLVGGVVLGAAAALAFAPQVMVWYYYSGRPWPVQAEPIRWATPFFTAALFSTRGGLFPWSPIAYASTLGVALALGAPRDAGRRLVLALAAVFALELYVIASAWLVTGAYAYGARRLSDGAVLIGVALGLLYQARPRWRRVVVGFTVLCVALNLLSMELVRQRRVASSGGYPRTAGRWLEEAHAPAWSQRLFERIGYPFVQPAGWLFALYYHVPPSTFEGVVGNFLLERDGQWFTVLNHTLPLERFTHSYAVEGLAIGEKPPATVTGRVRLLIPLFAREPFYVQVSGTVEAGALAATWNGAPLPVARQRDGLRIDVPKAVARAGTNELVLDVPTGSKLKELEFTPTSRWW